MTTTPLPPHGTLRRAMGDRRKGWARCLCPPCRIVERRYTKRRLYLATIGTPILVSAEPAREHLAKLRAAGDAYTVIASKYDIPRRTLNRLTNGELKRLHHTTAAKILAIEPGTATDNYRSVDAIGATRRTRALIAAGHSLNLIAEACGLQHSTASILINGHQTTIRHELNERVTRGYQQLSNSRGNSVRSLRRAKRDGWHDPLWWEDMGHIDDPDFDPAAAEQELSRNELAKLRRDEIEHLLSFNCSIEEIANRVDDLHVGTVRAIVAELRTGQRRERRVAA